MSKINLNTSLEINIGPFEIVAAFELDKDRILPKASLLFERGHGLQAQFLFFGLSIRTI